MADLDLTTGEDSNIREYIKENFTPVEDKPGYVWLDKRNSQIISIETLVKSWMPTIGEKVIVDDKYAGYVVRVFPPNEYHSGRFIVQMHFKYGSVEREFWFDDWGVTVKENKP